MSDDDVVYFDSEAGPAIFDGADSKGHFWTLCRYFVSEKFMTCCGEDRFLLMDVARYKLPPCWVRGDVLCSALTGQDSVSKKSRGFLIVSHPNVALVSN